MESTHLKESLAKLATLKSRSEQIQSDDNRAAIKKSTTGGISDFVYPTMCGQLSGAIIAASWEVASAQRSAERLEAIEREHQRFVTIFEGLGVDFDEEALSALETLSTGDEFNSERRELASAINKAIRETQSDVRDMEHDNATDALLAAGFAIDDEGEYFTRGYERVTVTLVNGRESRYEWLYETTVHPNEDLDIEPTESCEVDSGKSGDFHRLLELIKPEQSDPACGVATAVAPCDAEAKA